MERDQQSCNQGRRLQSSSTASPAPLPPLLLLLGEEYRTWGADNTGLRFCSRAPQTRAFPSKGAPAERYLTSETVI